MTLDIAGYENFYFEMLEQRYAKEREHIDSVAKNFPSLESVLKGESTLRERYQELHDKYSKLKPRLKDSMNPKKFYANVKKYVDELTPFVRMMESLSGKSLILRAGEDARDIHP